MRATAALLAVACAMASGLAISAQYGDSPVYLPGFYKLSERDAIWQYSDRSPWNIVKSAPWADPRLVKWGYVPVTHDSQNYYCLIDATPRTGSHIAERVFTCGDPATVEEIYNFNWRPVGRLYGGH